MATSASVITALIALIAVVIAWGQWHTARTKLVLDQKLFAVYDELLKALNPVFIHG